MQTTKYPHVNAYMQRFVDYDNAVGSSVKLNGRTPEEVWVDEPAMQPTDDYLAICSQDTIDALIVGGTRPVDMDDEVYGVLNAIMQTLWDEGEEADGQMMEGLDKLIKALNIKPSRDQHVALIDAALKMHRAGFNFTDEAIARIVSNYTTPGDVELSDEAIEAIHADLKIPGYLELGRALNDITGFTSGESKAFDAVETQPWLVPLPHFNSFIHLLVGSNNSTGGEMDLKRRLAQDMTEEAPAIDQEVDDYLGSLTIGQILEVVEKTDPDSVLAKLNAINTPSYNVARALHHVVKTLWDEQDED